MKTKTTAEIWITFFGLFILLLGVFAAGRTAFNIYKFGERYPQSGVLAFNTSGTPPYIQTESNCNTMSSPSYDASGKPMAPDEAQKKLDAQNKKNCLSGIEETREQVKWADIGTAVMLLFVGAGILSTRRFFFA